MLADSGISPGEMTSFNHYALGSAINFLHEKVGGITALAAGWKRISIHPRPGVGITSVKLAFKTPYGLLKVAWTLSEMGVSKLELEIPLNVTALVQLPTSLKAIPVKQVGSGRHNFTLEYVMEDDDAESRKPQMRRIEGCTPPKNA